MCCHHILSSMKFCVCHGQSFNDTSCKISFCDQNVGNCGSLQDLGTDIAELCDSLLHTTRNSSGLSHFYSHDLLFYCGLVVYSLGFAGIDSSRQVSSGVVHRGCRGASRVVGGHMRLHHSRNGMICNSYLANTWPLNSPHKVQWRGALVFSLIWVWINGWVNNRHAGDLRRFRVHYDVIVMGDWSAKPILAHLCNPSYFTIFVNPHRALLTKTSKPASNWGAGYNNCIIKNMDVINHSCSNFNHSLAKPSEGLCMDD